MSLEKELLENKIAGLEHQIKIGKEQNTVAEAIARLMRNRDFKTVILNEYAIFEVARFMEVATDPNVHEEIRTMALQDAKAPAALKRWLDARQRMSEDFNSRTRVELEDAIAELRAEIASHHDSYPGQTTFVDTDTE